MGKRYRYEIDEPDPSARPWSDHWLLHTVLVLAAGVFSMWRVWRDQHTYS